MHDAQQPDRKISLTEQFRLVNGAHLSPNVDIPVISSDVSVNGVARELSFPQGSVVFVQEDIMALFPEAENPNISPDMRPFSELVDMMNFGELLDHAPAEIQEMRGEYNDAEMMRLFLANSVQGPSSLSINSNDRSDRPILHIPKAHEQEASLIIKSLGLPDSSYLNAPQAYIEAYNSYVTAHEIEHTHNGSTHQHGTAMHDMMINEISADHGSLRRHFNNDYYEFIMDIRAYDALGNTTDQNAHATHIWQEEYVSGNMPTLDESEAMASAPHLMHQRLLHLASDDPMGRFALRQSLDTDPVLRYGHYKVLHEQGAFNDIPFGNEFADKYLKAAERLLAPEYMEQLDIDALRDKLAPQTNAENNNLLHPNISAPAMGG